MNYCPLQWNRRFETIYFFSPIILAENPHRHEMWQAYQVKQSQNLRIIPFYNFLSTEGNYFFSGRKKSKLCLWFRCFRELMVKCSKFSDRTSKIAVDTVCASLSTLLMRVIVIRSSMSCSVKHWIWIFLFFFPLMFRRDFPCEIINFSFTWESIVFSRLCFGMIFLMDGGIWFACIIEDAKWVFKILSSNPISSRDWHAF